MLQGKKIILGVCGSIAAYKSALLIRQLVKEGAEVKVIMTRAATQFISPLTLATLSKHPVVIDFFDQNSGEWQSHIDLGLWADVFLVAPVSANSLARLANGHCDNMLSAVYLSARCPVFLAPAMDVDMYHHPATEDNIRKLKSFGNHIIDAGYGELASGLVGEGRMAEPEEILQILKPFLLDSNQSLTGKKILVTAGPTYESIDPVRFIGNHSSGKMGYAIAQKFAELGAKVILVSGPSSVLLENNDIEIKNVTTAQEMYEQCAEVYQHVDMAIFAAAVSDYRPAQTYDQKLKKGIQDLKIALTKTLDIAAEMGKRKKPHQINIGFALETNNELDNAYQKLISKNFDYIILNSLQDQGAGFGHDTNKIRIINRDNKIAEYELKSKKAVAEDIVNFIMKETL